MKNGFRATIQSLLLGSAIALTAGWQASTNTQKPGGSPPLFVERNGVVSMEAENASHTNHWKRIPGVSSAAMQAEAAGAWKGGVLRFDIEFKQAAITSSS